jgi:hypothetical protein
MPKVLKTLMVLNRHFKTVNPKKLKLMTGKQETGECYWVERGRGSCKKHY